MIPVMIVPVLTKPDLLYRMVDSIDHDIQHLIIIDNGRCVEPRQFGDWSRVIDRLSLIPMPANLGVAGSWNLGIKSSPFAPWWLIVNFDVEWVPGTLCAWDQDRRGALYLSGGSPPWCVFAVGEKVVESVGLFDEGLHPGYFEDNDYERRVKNKGFDVVNTGIPVFHDNSSTLSDGYESKNNVTFAANQRYYNRKCASSNFSPGEWSLGTRRRLSWD